MAQPFKKFMGQGDSGAKKKERIRQEKKKVRAETKEYFEKKKQEIREARAQGQATGYQSDRGRKEQTSRNEQPNYRNTGNEKSGRNSGKTSGYKPQTTRNTERGPGGKEQRFEKKPATGYKSYGEKKASGYKPKADRNTERGPGGKDQRFEKKPATGYKSYGERKASGYKPQATRNTEREPGGKEQRFEKKPVSGIKPQTEKKALSLKPRTTSNTEKATGFKPQASGNIQKAESFKPKAESNTGKAKQPGTQPETQNHKPETTNPKAETGSMPLNKFIAHAGICSRRDAVEIVKAGKVIVNGEKVLEPGHKVTDKDEIKVNGKKLFARRNLVYILLNKPKDFITTTEDPQGRKTVMDIVRNATPERVYPIGRLDRNTTGVLLLTNDGELAQKLSHPSYEIRKIYEVKLDKVLVKKDFDAIMSGITLEDGVIMPDLLAYADPKDKSIIGIEIHSGRNRIVRRIFEHLGYDVRNLDRVMYANLTKKNVDRGKWRFLTEKEVRLLKYLNSSYTKNKTASRG